MSPSPLAQRRPKGHVLVPVLAPSSGSNPSARSLCRFEARPAGSDSWGGTAASPTAAGTPGCRSPRCAPAFQAGFAEGRLKPRHLPPKPARHPRPEAFPEPPEAQTLSLGGRLISSSSRFVIFTRAFFLFLAATRRKGFPAILLALWILSPVFVSHGGRSFLCSRVIHRGAAERSTRGERCARVAFLCYISSLWGGGGLFPFFSFFTLSPLPAAPGGLTFLCPHCTREGPCE